MILVVIIAFICLITILISSLKLIKKGASAIEITLGTLYCLSLVLFAVGLSTHSTPYYIAIDTMAFPCYSPFSEHDGATLMFYFFLFFFSMILIWLNGNLLPPLTLVLCMIFILFGVILNLTILVQISVHKINSPEVINNGESQAMFLFAPLFSIIIGISLITKVMTEEIKETYSRKYSNKILRFLNNFLATKTRNPFWIFLLMFPVFFLVTLILMLFGQDSNSIIKVFTDTATWKLSQQVHPPVLEHNGHYLCTVASVGHPNIVKPLRLGKRNNKIIIVNRQLLIANAFEELVQDISPRLHCTIRKAYDNYGYNLSTKINSTFLSSLTYILMKPLEWVFLICLYLFCIKPEQKIKRQYSE